MEILGNGKWRTIVGLSTLYFWAMGFVTVGAIVYALPNWRWAFLAISLPTLLFVNYAYLIPESPMWLISQGLLSEAQVILNQAALRNKLPPVQGHHSQKSFKNYFPRILDITLFVVGVLVLGI